MLDRFYYESSDGKYKVEFGDEKGIYVNEHDVRGYQWQYKESRNNIYGFYKKFREKNLPLMFIGTDQKHLDEIRNNAFFVFERDVKLGKYGKLWINGYYLECFMVQSANSGFQHERYIVTNFNVLSSDTWKKETTYTFEKVERKTDGNELDLPYDFSYDLGASNDDLVKTINTNCIGECDFKLTIYGSVTNPDIIIGDYHYSITGTIAPNERVEIVSSENKRSIRIYAEDGTFIDWFGRRNKESSVFRKIPEGYVKVSHDGTFGFDLTLIDSRSEPPWEHDYSETVEATSTTSTMYLVDSNGQYILDSNDESIELGV